jgi:hypothetical protein
MADDIVAVSFTKGGPVMSTDTNALRQTIYEHLIAQEWNAQVQDNRIVATRQVIAFKWLLGRKTVRLDLECLFDEAAKLVEYRETAKESTLGIAPPSFSVTKYNQTGSKYSEKRTDVGVGGGGSMHYGEVRDWVEKTCQTAGFRFESKTGFIKKPLRS